jgi:NADH-quinone oxidoreductase subunit C
MDDDKRAVDSETAGSDRSVWEDNLIVKKLRERCPEAIINISGLQSYPDELTIKVPKEKIVELCRFLKDDPHLEFNYLSDLCGADYPDREERFEVVYHLYSITKRHRLRLKVSAKDGEPVPSVIDVWATANWHEREAYDLLGIHFEGHPDLRRILLPDDWEGYPLRKEYPLMGYDAEPKPD